MHDKVRLAPSALVFALALPTVGCGVAAVSEDVGRDRDSGHTTRDGSSDASHSADADRSDGAQHIDAAATADAGHDVDAGELDDAGLPGIDAATVDAGTTEPVRFVAVGYGGHRTVSLDGRTWDHHVIEDPAGGDDPRLLRGVGYGDGVFIAVGNRVMTSRDGIDWTTTIADTGSFLSDAAWDDGLWVTAGGNGLRMRSTDDGATFTDRAPGLSGHFRSIAAGDGTFVAVGHTYSDVGLSSTTHDGITWTDRTGGTAFAKVAFGAGVFVAVGSGGRVSVSSDGSTWEETTLGGDRLTDVAFVNGELVVRSDSAYWTSADGHVWARHGSFVPDAIAFHAGAYAGLTWSAPLMGASALEGPWRTVETTGPALTDIAVSGSP